MNKLKVLTISIVLLMLLSLASPSFGVSARPLAATNPPLGTLSTFSILATTAITDGPPIPPPSDVSGDVGISPAAGIPVSIIIGGAPHNNDGVAAQAVLDANAAALDMASQAMTASIGPGLNGVTVTPGVYDVGAGLLAGGTPLTLNGPGVYIFRASSSLTVAGTVSLINGARACDVYWRVESLATVNGTSFVGTIIAGTGVHFGAGVTLDGRAIARNGDVTLINDHITGPTCATPTPVPGGGGGNNVRALPNTGGAPIRNEDFPWSLATVIAGFSVIALALGAIAYRRTHLPKQ